MTGFLLRRLIGYAVLFVVAASLSYALAAVALDPRANFAGRNPPPPPHVVEAQLTAYNLNDATPLPERFLRWAGGVVRGDFGRSWEGESINAELARRAGVSLRLLLVGTLVGSALGVALGAFAAVGHYRLSDQVITLVSFGVLAVPVFVIAVALQIGGQWLNEATGVQVIEWAGETAAGAAGPDRGAFADLGGRLHHLVLPTATIALVQLAVISRYQRNAMLDVLHADHVRTAMGKGLRRRTALVRHGLRTALIPVVTYFAYNVGLLLTGATFVEKIYGWHGVGEWLVDSISRNDVNAVAAISCFAAVLVVGAGLLSDLVAAALDPRVRAGL